MWDVLGIHDQYTYEFMTFNGNLLYVHHFFMDGDLEFITDWDEMLAQNSRIARPRQLYIGASERPYVPIGER